MMVVNISILYPRLCNSISVPTFENDPETTHSGSPQEQRIRQEAFKSYENLNLSQGGPATQSIMAT